MYKRFLLNSKDEAKAAYIFNPVGGMLNACQSALLLIVISRTNPIEDSGMYSLAYAIASLALTLGLFGIRHFQSSDVKEEYPFETYLSARVVSNVMMIAIILYYVIKGLLFQDYSVTKILLIITVGALKVIDSTEDVYQGRLQQNGRLDVAAKALFVRYTGFLIVTALTLVISKNILISFAVGFALSLFGFFFHLHIYGPLLNETSRKGAKDDSYTGSATAFGSISDKKTWALLKNTFSVMLGGFLMIYVANAPKYAIDAKLTEADQAMFNYIFMPVYIVSTLTLYIFQPVITKMAEKLEEGDTKAFKKIFGRQIIVISVISALVLMGGFLLGIPVLSLFYNTDLAPLKMPFMILLLGGCILAFASFVSVCVIILRGQDLLLIGYAIPAIAEFLFAGIVVDRYGISGVAILYSSLILLQLLVFALVLMLKYNKVK